MAPYMTAASERAGPAVLTRTTTGWRDHGSPQPQAAPHAGTLALPRDGRQACLQRLVETMNSGVAAARCSLTRRTGPTEGRQVQWGCLRRDLPVRKHPMTVCEQA